MRRLPFLTAALLATPFVAALPGPSPVAAAPTAAIAPARATPPQTGEAHAAPAAVTLVPGRLDVFEQTAYDTLHQVVRSSPNGGWSKVYDLGGPIRSAPAAASPASREVYVFARGDADALVVKGYTAGRWTGWSSLGGRISSAPAAVSSAPGRVDVFARGVNNILYVRSLVNGKWGGWQGLGGVLTSAPAAASDGNGTLRVFVRGAGGIVYEKVSTRGVWSRGWTQHPGAVASSPGAAGQRDGRVDLFARGSDGRLLVDSLVAGRWSGWVQQEADLASAPGAVSLAPGSVEVVARHADGLLRTTAGAGGAWSEWRQVPVGLGRPVTRTLAQGVEFDAYFDAAGPWAVQQVTYALSSPARLDTELAREELAGFEQTSAIAQRRDALVAVNGDFGLPSGRPVHAYAEDGRLEQHEQESGYMLTYDARQQGARIGAPLLERTLEHRRTRVRMPVDQVNPVAVVGDQLAEFTPAGRGVAAPPTDSCSAQIRPSNDPTLRTDGRVQRTYMVEAVTCGATPPAVDGDASVVSTRIGSARDPFVRGLQLGDEIYATWTTQWRHVNDLLGGNPVLVSNGAVASSNVDHTGAYFARQPRTGVGYTNDGRMFVVTVDGRQPGYSVGMNLREFAELFVRLGAVWALNLDGGGSTTMVVEGAITNRTCCNVTTGAAEERAVSSALLILRGADPDEAPPPLLPAPSPSASGSASASATPTASGSASTTPSGTPTASGSPAALAPGGAPLSVFGSPLRATDAMLDPGSTGGLAAALQAQRLPLSPELRWVAETYTRSRLR